MRIENDERMSKTEWVSAASGITNSAEAFVVGWADMWAGKKADAYFGLYASDFWPTYGDAKSMSDFEQQRRSVMLRPGDIKVASAAQRFDAPRYETTADAHNAVAIGVAGASIAAAAARIGPLTEPQAKMNAKPTATLVAAASSGAVQSIGASVGATAPNMLATLSQKETPTAGLALRTDGEFTSYKGMVGFQQGSMVLDGLSRQKVAELAPMARDAERVRLRGRVASSQLTEDMKKLAVGRAYAVKVEFGKHDVDKAKIRILNPQQANAENATGTVRGVDVMLDMPEKKSLSGMVKEGA